MNIDSDDLLARIKKEFPIEFELALLRFQVDLLSAENDRLNAMAAPGYDPTAPRPYLEEGRHG